MGRYNQIFNDRRKFMQVSQTYDYAKKDDINRKDMAIMCSKYFNIKDVLPILDKIAAPVSELSHYRKDGDRIFYREETYDAIPWDERSMKTFGVVYSYESTASFIGMDGKTYIVPNDQPVLDYLQECGYTIAPYGKNLDGSNEEVDSLIYEERPKNDEEFFCFGNKIDKNLPSQYVTIINDMEQNRPYYGGYQSYASVIRFGGTLGLRSASEEEVSQISLSERKIANISTYGRINEGSRLFKTLSIEEYIEYALQQTYLNEELFKNSFCSYKGYKS